MICCPQTRGFFIFNKLLFVFLYTYINYPNENVAQETVPLSKQKIENFRVRENFQFQFSKRTYELEVDHIVHEYLNTNTNETIIKYQAHYRNRFRFI